MTLRAPAGWYLDPIETTRRRYWTGERWAQSNDPLKGTAPPPAPPGLPTPPARPARGRPASAPRSEVVCPHCQVRGKVTVTPQKVKRGISGAKATGAILTAGVSIFGTGLSRKERVNLMRCGNCGVTWTA